MTRRKVDSLFDAFSNLYWPFQGFHVKKHVLKNACFFRSFLKFAKDRGQTDDYLQGLRLTLWRVFDFLAAFPRFPCGKNMIWKVHVFLGRSWNSRRSGLKPYGFAYVLDPILFSQVLKSAHVFRSFLKFVVSFVRSWDRFGLFTQKRTPLPLLFSQLVYFSLSFFIFLYIPWALRTLPIWKHPKLENDPLKGPWGSYNAIKVLIRPLRTLGRYFKGPSMKLNAFSLTLGRYLNGPQYETERVQFDTRALLEWAS